MIANANCIHQAFELEGGMADILTAEVVGNCAERKDELIVGNGISLTAGRIDQHMAAAEIHACDSRPHNIGAVKAGAERTADV